MIADVADIDGRRDEGWIEQLLAAPEVAADHVLETKVEAGLVVDEPERGGTAQDIRDARLEQRGRDLAHLIRPLDALELHERRGIACLEKAEVFIEIVVNERNDYDVRFVGQHLPPEHVQILAERRTIHPEPVDFRLCTALSEEGFQPGGKVLTAIDEGAMNIEIAHDHSALDAFPLVFS